MKAIVFIGTHKSGSSRDAIQAAKKLGYTTVLITDIPKQINQRLEYVDVDNMIYCKNNINKLFQIIKDLPMEVSAIVSFVDPHCETANILAEKLGLNHFTIDAISKMEDKYKSRKALEKTDYTPKFMVIKEVNEVSKEKIDKIRPMIIKYPQSQGSKDVYLVKDYNEYIEAVKKIKTKYPDSEIIIEEYLEGPQYLVEVMVVNGVINIVAVIEQEISYLNGHFIITGYNLMINIDQDFYLKLNQAVVDIVKSHGLKSGPCHLEMRYVKDKWKLIEINPRISGAGMNTFLEIGLGINLVEETLKLALNEKINLTPKYQLNTFAEYVVVNNPGTLLRTTGRNKALNCNGVKYVFVKPRKGSILTPPESMGDRYAYVIATGESEDDARSNAKYAAAKIQFELE